MSELTTMMKFEFLPNEIFIHCFEYLSAWEIFDSFDQLNYRFNKLIRNIPLHLDFQNVRKSTFDRFCTKMLLNPQIKNQIYSLNLSNKDTSGQIQAFLSFFSLNEFSRLRSLTLTQVTKENMVQLKSMLLLTPHLYCFHLRDVDPENNKMLSTLPISKLRILSMPSVYPLLTSVNELVSITNLTISQCYIGELYQLLKYVPMVKYLTVDLIKYSHSVENDIFIGSYQAIHLEQLIIGNSWFKFENFEMFLKQTVNLKSLTVSKYDGNDAIDADRWEYLITSSLPYLNIFKFKFVVRIKSDDKTILHKFQKFQSDFWHKHHHWYTECILEKYSAYIFTTPYFSNSFMLESYTDSYSNNLIKDFNIFNNVTNLDLHILKESPQLSTLTLNGQVIRSFIEKSELCQDLNKMIRRINIGNFSNCLFDNYDNVKKFCEIFSYIEHLECTTTQSDYFLFALNHLSKLSTMKVFGSSSFDNRKEYFSQFQNEARKRNLLFHIEPFLSLRTTFDRKLNIWIDNRKNQDQFFSS